MDIFWKEVSKYAKSGPVLTFGVVYDAATMESNLPAGFQAKVIITQTEAEAAYLSAT